MKVNAGSAASAGRRDDAGRYEALRPALASFKRGDLDDAELRCRQVLDAEPRNTDALNVLAVIEVRRGHLEHADELLQRALAIEPRSPSTLGNRANVLKARGLHADAVASYDAALALKPDAPEILNSRGVSLNELERYDEALASFDRALALQAPFALAHYNRGVALQRLKRFDEAIASYDRALAIQPSHKDALRNRGASLAVMKRYDEAIACYDRALAVDPAFAEVLHNRASVLSTRGRYEEAVADLERALALKPDLPAARGALLQASMLCCDWREHEPRVAEVLAEVREGKSAMMPFAFLAVSDSPLDQALCARAWVRDQCPAAPVGLWTGERYRHSRIKLAYVAADFHEHPLGQLMAGLFESHDRTRFETHAISLGPDTGDPMRARLKGAFEHFIDAQRRNDGEVAALMRELEIDIAVDRNGHTAGARTAIFALRPAPIQVNYLAYPGTMGARYIDYIVADRTVIPASEEGCYDEKIVRLPDSYQVNDAKRRIAERTHGRADAGLPEQGFVFCSFNNNYKITPEVFEVWMRVLRQVEGSVLWLLESHEAVPRNLRREALARGVAPERLVFAPRIPHAEHLARQQLADLFLDTLPYGAHTTASDALWAGLPVLTRTGTTFAGRVAASLLHAVGLPELVTESTEAYEALALELARRPERLRPIRGKLAAERGRAPLFDTERSRRHLEAAYIAMWERQQRGEPPEAFAVSAMQS